MKMNFKSYDSLENLPSLKKDWVRLVHRCIMGNGENVKNIKAHGLIFNRYAAKCQPHQKGGSYNHVTSMVSVYNEDTFWQSMKQDDFACFNDEKYADTKLVFDIPFEEFCFLQSFGRIVKGKIDSKYMVGCIENVNAQNAHLKAPISEVIRAEKISRENLPSDAKINNVSTLINHLIMKFPKEQRAAKINQIYEKMNNCKEEILTFFAEENERYKAKKILNGEKEQNETKTTNVLSYLWLSRGGKNNLL